MKLLLESKGVTTLVLLLFPNPAVLSGRKYGRGTYSDINKPHQSMLSKATGMYFLNAKRHVSTVYLKRPRNAFPVLAYS